MHGYASVCMGMPHFQTLMDLRMVVGALGGPWHLWIMGDDLYALRATA